jgi:hypothetical protein
MPLGTSWYSTDQLHNPLITMLNWKMFWCDAKGLQDVDDSETLNHKPTTLKSFNICEHYNYRVSRKKTPALFLFRWCNMESRLTYLSFKSNLQLKLCNISAIRYCTMLKPDKVAGIWEIGSGAKVKDLRLNEYVPSSSFKTKCQCSTQSENRSWRAALADAHSHLVNSHWHPLDEDR